MASRSTQGGGSIVRVEKERNGKCYVYWEARFVLNGKRKTISCSTRKEAQSKLTSALADIERGEYMEPSKMCVGDWLSFWLENYVKNAVKPLTYKSYDTSIKNHIKPELGAVLLQKLTPMQVQQFYNRCLEKSLSPKSIKNLSGILHAALDKAIKAGLLHYNVVDACTLPKITRTMIVPLTKEQQRIFVQESQKSPYGNLFITALYTGLRQGEALGLCWDCIDFDRKTILIKQQRQKLDGAYRLVPTKTNNIRTVPLLPIVEEALRKEKRLQAERHLLLGTEWNNKHNLVFLDALGKMYAVPTLEKHFKRIVASAGAPNARFHDLRHTAITTFIESGIDMKTVQYLAGHSTITTTMDTYGHITEYMQKESFEKLKSYVNKLV